MDAEIENRIRVTAYHLWEAAGRPLGQDEVNWTRAKEIEFAKMTHDAPIKAPKKKSAPKKKARVN